MAENTALLSCKNNVAHYLFHDVVVLPDIYSFYSYMHHLPYFSIHITIPFNFHHAKITTYTRNNQGKIIPRISNAVIPIKNRKSSFICYEVKSNNTNSCTVFLLPTLLLSIYAGDRRSSRRYTTGCQIL